MMMPLVFCGCRKTESDSVHTQEIIERSPEEIAKYLCQYSRGSFPNWILYSHYEKYLSQSEAQAVKYIAEKLRETIAPSGRPKQLAIATFISLHTECIPVPEETSIDENSGLTGYVFEQHVPVVPHVPDVISDTSMSDDKITKLYMDAFDSSWNGDYRTRKIQIVLEQTENGQYLIKTRIAPTFARHLREDLFWRSMDAEWYDKAAEQLEDICQNDDELCKSLSPFMDSAYRVTDDMKQRFYHEVDVGEIQYKLVALTKNNAYTVAYFTLTHHGSSPYHHIIFTTDEKNPQHCELQASQNKRDDDPLVLNPGQTLQAWCALNSDTLPTVQLSYYSSR